MLHGAKRFFTYVSWDQQWKERSNIQEIKEAIQQLGKEGKNEIYVLVIQKEYDILSFLENDAQFQRIFVVNNGMYDHCVWDEQYVLYGVNGSF